ncbi:DUF4124 domain-containing protein [Allochromatium humboldtianum]|uniref:DUF4124 domain-containing protein n=1 Tax=Allochromatium humboldtianum TaxID=504901 RepID=A0A850R6S9_9GAMM|nr:DUF4124 domain-containing protein [Allochromatium humboldtianum]NVZ09504.1 DUF4124 domain-containing protein [Allochromatium humboldtianum]
MSRSAPSKRPVSARRLAILMLMPVLGLASWTASAQKLYRWVDDQGEVHYTDQVPPAQADKARARLSEQGIAVETQPAVPTGEELERARELARQKAEEERRRAERQAKDERLLKLYRTVDELELARDGRIAAIEASIQAKRDDMRDETRTLIALYEEMRTLQKAEKPVPLDLMSRIDSSMTNIRNGYTEIVDNEARKQSVQDEFEGDIARFRQLRRLPAPDESAVAARPERNGSTLVSCRDREQCHAYWERAVSYVRAHSDRDGEVLGPGLLIAFQQDEREIRTLTIAWTQEAVDRPVWIYLDIQCRHRLTASLICVDPNVPRVREGFRAAVMDE